jgi:hypothetical protein
MFRNASEPITFVIKLESTTLSKGKAIRMSKKGSHRRKATTAHQQGRETRLLQTRRVSPAARLQLDSGEVEQGSNHLSTLGYDVYQFQDKDAISRGFSHWLKCSGDLPWEAEYDGKPRCVSYGWVEELQQISSAFMLPKEATYEPDQRFQRHVPRGYRMLCTLRSRFFRVRTRNRDRDLAYLSS